MPKQWAELSRSSVPLSEVKAELFKALAHPARVRVLEVLAEGERSVGELQPLVGIELSPLSQQLGVLRRGGLLPASPASVPASPAVPALRSAHPPYPAPPAPLPLLSLPYSPPPTPPPLPR